MLGLLHLGRGKGAKPAPERAPLEDFRTLTSRSLMLARADAIAALDGEPFDVLVIGGGITGAGVALDAATRGYSVALVERGDFAIGHLVALEQARPRRPALPAELRPRARARGAAGAPDQRRAGAAPRPAAAAVVPAFDGARPDRLVGLGLNMYDVMAVDRISPLGRRRDRNRDGVEDWSPARHRVISGEEVAELLPALAGRAPDAAATSSTTARPTTSRLVLTVLAEAERFGAVAANRRRGARAARGGRPRGRRARARRARAATSSRCAPPTSSTPPACGPTGCGPSELHDEAEVPVIRPSRGTHIIARRRDAAAGARARSCPRAAGARSSCCRGSGRR